MAYAGQIIENPVSGERITFLRTAADTDGESLAIELELAPGGRAPGMHVHPLQRERFEVVEGEMTFKCGRRKAFAARPRQIVDIPPGNAHKVANAGDTKVVCRVEITPALDMEVLLETACALAAEGKALKSGLPKLLARIARAGFGAPLTRPA
jgi:mannose-6-phosphate isomerase-like protein (cupin superfamily)